MYVDIEYYFRIPRTVARLFSKYLQNMLNHVIAKYPGYIIADEV